MAKKAAKKTAKPPAKKVAAKKPQPTKKAAPPAKETSDDKRDRPMRSDLLILGVKDLVEVNGFNVREDMGDIEGLAQSIAEVGIKVPLRGYKIKGGKDDGKYALVNGHRRYAAALLVVKKQPDLRIPLQPEPQGYTDEQRNLDLIVTNEGNKLSMMEEAVVVGRLITDFNMERQHIASKIGKTDQHVADLETLLTASPGIKKMIKKNQVSATAVIATIRDKDGDMEAVEGALEKGMEKAGGGRVTPKHIEKSKASKKPTLADLKDAREELENRKPSENNKRLGLLDFVISYLNGEMSQKKFVNDFFPEKKADGE